MNRVSQVTLMDVLMADDSAPKPREDSALLSDACGVGCSNIDDEAP